MFEIKQYEEVLRNEMKKLKKEVKLMIFTDVKEQEDRTKRRWCMSCDTTMDLLKTLSEFSGGKLNIKEYSIEEDKNIAEKYNIIKIPTILFIDDEGRDVIRYLGNPLGAETAPFVQSLIYFSGVRSFYDDAVIANLKHMRKSKLKLFYTLTCPFCPGVVPIVNLFAILSRGKVKAELIDINVNQEYAIKYKIQGVPHVMINNDQHLYGVFTPQDLLEKMTQGKRDFGGMYS
ncbi:MAG: thioredoxin family protein [Promethearchaeota archaeon]